MTNLGPLSADNQNAEENAGRRCSERIREYQFSDGVAIDSIPDKDQPPEVTYCDVFNDSSSFIVHPSYGPDPQTMQEALKCKDANDWIAADLQEFQKFKELDAKNKAITKELQESER